MELNLSALHQLLYSSTGLYLSVSIFHYYVYAFTILHICYKLLNGMWVSALNYLHLDNINQEYLGRII